MGQEQTCLSLLADLQHMAALRMRCTINPSSVDLRTVLPRDPRSCPLGAVPAFGYGGVQAALPSQLRSLTKTRTCDVFSLKRSHKIISGLHCVRV